MSKQKEMQEPGHSTEPASFRNSCGVEKGPGVQESKLSHTIYRILLWVGLIGLFAWVGYTLWSLGQ